MAFSEKVPDVKVEPDLNLEVKKCDEEEQPPEEITSATGDKPDSK